MFSSSLPRTSPNMRDEESATTLVQASSATPARRGASRRGLRSVGALVLVAVLVVMGASCTKNVESLQSVQLANGERNARGIRGLVIDDTLVEKAQAWAEHMAAVGGISHSRLTDGAGSNWRILGENVGVAGSVAEVNRLFMNSAPHRANILNGAYNRIGTGVAVVGGRYFVAQVFAG